MFSLVLLLHRESRSAACQHPVTANTRVPMGPSERQ